MPGCSMSSCSVLEASSGDLGRTRNARRCNSRGQQAIVLQPPRRCRLFQASTRCLHLFVSNVEPQHTRPVSSYSSLNCLPSFVSGVSTAFVYQAAVLALIMHPLVGLLKRHRFASQMESCQSALTSWKPGIWGYSHAYCFAWDC